MKPILPILILGMIAAGLMAGCASTGTTTGQTRSAAADQVANKTDKLDASSLDLANDALVEQRKQKPSQKQAQGDASTLSGPTYQLTTDETEIHTQLAKLHQQYRELLLQLKSDFPYALVRLGGFDFGTENDPARSGDSLLDYARIDEHGDLKITYESLKDAGKQDIFKPFDFFIGKPFVVYDEHNSQRVHIGSLALVIERSYYLSSLPRPPAPEDFTVSGGEWRLVLIPEEPLMENGLVAEYEGFKLFGEERRRELAEEEAAIPSDEHPEATDVQAAFEEGVVQKGEQMHADMIEKWTQEDGDEFLDSWYDYEFVPPYYLQFFKASFQVLCDQNDYDSGSEFEREWEDDDCGESYDTVSVFAYLFRPGGVKDLPFELSGYDPSDFQPRKIWWDPWLETLWFVLENQRFGQDSLYMLQEDTLVEHLSFWIDGALACDH